MIYIDGIPEEFTGDLSDYVDRNTHREDGPAIIWDDGGRAWWLNGKCHRTDGPAIEDNGSASWWFEGHWYSFEEFIKKAKLSDEQAVLLALEWL
jgi:hypothetical protein